jgi:hypothetical protein
VDHAHTAGMFELGADNVGKGSGGLCEVAEEGHHA